MELLQVCDSANLKSCRWIAVFYPGPSETWMSKMSPHGWVYGVSRMEYRNPDHTRLRSSRTNKLLFLLRQQRRIGRFQTNQLAAVTHNFQMLLQIAVDQTLAN